MLKPLKVRVIQMVEQEEKLLGIILQQLLKKITLASGPNKFKLTAAEDRQVWL